MKKSEKVNLISTAEGTYMLCRCFFDYDKDYWYFYILAHSEKFILGIEECDFLLNGYQIRKIADLKKIEYKDDLCTKINRESKILDGVKTPEVNLSSWRDIILSLQRLSAVIIVENEKSTHNGPYFYVGRISEVKKTSFVFCPFDADGVWLSSLELPYSEITSITFGDRYSSAYAKYLENNRT